MTRDTVIAALSAQYAAALRTLREAIRQCPDDLWYDSAPANRFWHVVCHTLFYTDLYLHPSEADFVPWTGWREDYQWLGPYPWDPNSSPAVDQPYTRSELEEYAGIILDRLPQALAGIDLDGPSGFDWILLGKLEHQIYNIRHIQHHAAQLIDRLRENRGIHVVWIGTR